MVSFVVLSVLGMRPPPTPCLFLERSEMAPPSSCQGDQSCSGFLGQMAQSLRTTPALCRLACENDALFPVQPQQELEQHPPSPASEELPSDKNWQRCPPGTVPPRCRGRTHANATGEPPRSRFLKGDTEARCCFHVKPTQMLLLTGRVCTREIPRGMPTGEGKELPAPRAGTAGPSAGVSKGTQLAPPSAPAANTNFTAQRLS